MSEWFLSEQSSFRGCWRRMGRGAQCAVIISLGLVLAAGSVAEFKGESARWDAVTIALAGLVWTAAVAVAAGLPAWGYLVAGLWLGWHGVALMGAWTGTLWVALPVLWWLWTGLAVVAWRGPRGRQVQLSLCVAMALWAGYLLAGPVGWNRLPGNMGGVLWVGRLLIGLAIALIGWWLLPRMRRWNWTLPNFGRVWAGSIAVLFVGLGAAVWRDAEASAGWAGSVLESCRWFGVIGWFWAGGLFGFAMVVLLEKGSRLSRITRPAIERRVLPMLWFAVTGVEWVASHEEAQEWVRRLPFETGGWLVGWPSHWQIVAEAHAWGGVVVLVLGVGHLLQGRSCGLPHTLLRLNTLWIAAFAALVLMMPALPGSEGKALLVDRWGPLLVIIAGWTAAAGPLIRQCESRAEGSGGRPWGLLVMGAGLMLAGQISDPGAWGGTGATAASLGMIHLTVPLLLYRWWNVDRQTHDRLTISTLGWLAALGIVGILPLLHRDAVAVSQLAFCPVWWFAVLVGLRVWRPGLDTTAGALAGGLMGSASIAAWSRPGLMLPEVPVLSWLNPPIEALFGSNLPPRPFFDAPHFTLFLLMTSAGAMLGVMVFWSRTAQGVPLMPLFTDSLKPPHAPLPPG